MVSWVGSFVQKITRPVLRFIVPEIMAAEWTCLLLCVTINVFLFAGYNIFALRCARYIGWVFEL